MGSVVLDCSVLMSGLLPDEAPDFNLESLSHYTFHVPSVFCLEMTNALFSSLKRKRISEQYFEECLTLLQNTPLKVDIFTATPKAVMPLKHLSQQYNLTPYDASYLELAQRLQIPLATFDQKLKEACQAAQIPVVP